MNNASDQIGTCKWIYLNEIGEPRDNSLRIVLGEASSGAPMAAGTSAAGALPELEKILDGARPLLHGSGCRIFELTWASYIAYSVRNESFVSADKSEVFTGRLLVEYSKSKYLDFVEAATFADATFPGPFKHYGIHCLNHIVDVVSLVPPEIQITVHA